LKKITHHATIGLGFKLSVKVKGNWP